MIDDNTTKQAIKDTKWRIIEKHERITCYDAMQRQDQRMLIEMCNDTNWHFISPMIGRICTCLALAKMLSPLVVNGHKAPPYSNATSLFFLDLALILIFISPTLFLIMRQPPIGPLWSSFPVHVQLLACLLGSTISPPLESNTRKESTKITMESPTYYDPQDMKVEWITIHETRIT